MARLSESDDERLYHLGCCQSAQFTILGYTVNNQTIKAEISKLLFKQKLTEMRVNIGDEEWFRHHLFKNSDLHNVEECISSVPSELGHIIITSTVQTLLQTKSFILANKWLSFAFNAGYLSPELAFLFYNSVLSYSSETIPNSLLNRIQELCYNLENGSLADDYQLTLVRCLAGIVLQSKDKLIERIWFYLSIDSLDKISNCEFLRLLVNVELPVQWNIIRVINGLPQYFDTESPCDTIEPSTQLDLKKSRALEKIQDPIQVLQVFLDIYNFATVKDDLKYVEFIEFLCNVLSKLKPENLTNKSILARFFERPLLECWKRTNVPLFRSTELQVLVAKALYRKVKILSRLKRKTDHIREWRDDLIISIAGFNVKKIWQLLAQISMQLLRHELARYHESRTEVYENDLKIAFTAIFQSDCSEEYLSEIYLCLTRGVISNLEFDRKVLSKTLVETCKLKSASYNVYIAMVTACPDVKIKLNLLTMLSRHKLSFNQSYNVALELLEMASQQDYIVAQVKMILESLFISEWTLTDSIDETLISWAIQLGSLDNNKLHHRHLYFIAINTPSIDAWSKLFPFLLTPKTPSFSNIWQIEKDLPGMHLVYKSRYVSDLIKFLIIRGDSEKLFSTFRKIANHYSELFDGQSVVELALRNISHLGSPKEAHAAFNLLKRLCTNDQLIYEIKASIGV